MIETAKALYDVGGVGLERPFKVRRLGHVGFNCARIDETFAFYRDALGFTLSDRIDFSRMVPNAPDLTGLGDPSGYFMRYGSDHHSLVLFNKSVREALDKVRRFAPGVRVNQISWQVGGLSEVVNGNAYLKENGEEVQRNGRDWPGSNWHTYFYDPDGHTNELFYGMEQIGWQRKSKPAAMQPMIYCNNPPPLPQRSERNEVAAAVAAGIDVNAGRDSSDAGLPELYDVDGILLPRPFRVTKIGPVALFVHDVEKSNAFYTRRLGFTATTRVTWEGFTCVYLRAGLEHHSIMLAPIELRAKLGFFEDSTTMSLGLHIATFRQLRAARDFLRERGARIIALPPELHPGIDYAFHVSDPEGHCIQLYFGMEQLARQTIAHADRDPEHWPLILDHEGALFEGETFMGPLG
jgi:catechol 2,3-dioxygenase-like lactoylglutathione lyase family enzyme